MSSDWLTVAEAGEALGVSVSTVWRRIRRGELPSVRRRGRRLVPARAVRSRRTPMATEVPPLDDHHPIFALIGAGRGGGRTPGARDKHGVFARNLFGFMRGAFEIEGEIVGPIGEP